MAMSTRSRNEGEGSREKEFLETNRVVPELVLCIDNKETISHVSLSFGDNDRPNPTKDEGGDLGRVLSRLFRVFRNKDSNPKQQKVLPAQVLARIYKRK